MLRRPGGRGRGQGAGGRTSERPCPRGQQHGRPGRPSRRPVFHGTRISMAERIIADGFAPRLDDPPAVLEAAAPLGALRNRDGGSTAACSGTQWRRAARRGQPSVSNEAIGFVWIGYRLAACALRVSSPCSCS